MVDSGEMAKNLIKAFNDGYQMGVGYGRKVFGIARKINVNQHSTTQEIEFMRLSDGSIHNYGRSIPF